MKRILYLLTLSAFVYSCAHAPISETGPSRIAPNVLLRELEVLHRRSLMHIRDGEISEGIHLLVLTLAKGASGVPTTDAFAITEIVRRVEATLQNVQRRISVTPGSGWSEEQPGRFTPENEEEPDPLGPSFTIRYRHDDRDLPLQGISYSLRFVRDGGRTVTKDKTGVTGQGGCSIEQIEEVRDSETDTVLELLCSYGVSGYSYTFDRVKLRYVYPPQRVFVEIKRGERVKDLLERLVERRLTTYEAFLFVAASGIYPESELVPPPRANINRFEGLFRPGRYYLPGSSIRKLIGESERGANSGVDSRGKEGIAREQEFARKPEFAGKQEFARKSEFAGEKDFAITNAGRIIRRLIQESTWSPDDVPPSNGLGGYEQLVLASIIEKEAVANRDYERVASVFYNRLNMGSQLASCPAVEYALGYHRPFLKREDILIDSPYNLYTREGLPPTPISFFGEEALNAVKKPLESNLLYFVYDWTLGRLTFAAAYQEHLENARRARENYARTYGANALYRIHYDKYYEE